MNNVSLVLQPNINISVDGSTLIDQNVAVKQIEVKTGATIQGTVVSVTDTEEGKIANINVGNGEIQARLSDSMGLREGQNLNFIVRGTGANGITISPLYENTSADQSTLKALTAAGIEITNDTINMVKEMMETGLPIDKSSLLEMSKNLSMHPNTSISTMVEMKSLNIPITENNIEQYGSYKNYEHQVINDMKDIINALPEAFNKLAESGNTNGAVNLYGSVLKLFSAAPNEGNTVQTPMGITDQTSTADQTSTTNLTNTVNAKTAETLANQTDTSISNTDTGVAESGSNNQEISPKQVFSQNFLDNLRNLNISESTVDALTKEQSQSGSLSQTNNLQTNAQNGTQTQSIINDATKELFKELATAFEESDLSNPVETAAWKKLFSSEEFGKLLKDNIESQWLIKPGDVEKKENIENLYQRLGNQAKTLADAVNNSPVANSALGQAANNLNNNLDFMNQLNQVFQYIQLPLQMTGQNAHGDLYVYQNKHKKLSEDGSVSAVLHLDMENLGPVDVFVKLLDTKVTTNFYVMDDDVISLINDNIHILNERLEKRGYSMQVNLKLHNDMDGQDAAVDEMLDVSRTPVISTASFDARA